jgi:hypothetical protein
LARLAITASEEIAQTASLRYPRRSTYRKQLPQRKTSEIRGMTRLQYTHPVAEVRVKSGLTLQCAYDCYKNLQNQDGRQRRFGC